jgi:hypothetical protein
MCNVVHLLFTCQHTLKRRRSSCKGTKHKVTATSIKAACTAESFLTIVFQVPCCKCQHKEWERTWHVNRKTARSFLDKLTEKNLPGVYEIRVLVEQLEARYKQESWNLSFFGPKPSVGRVNYSEYRRAISPLPQIVRPQDIVDSQIKAWVDMDDNDYDPDYIASTDPIHLVSTDYSHPLDGDDGSWIAQQFSPEDLEAPQGHSGIDFLNDNPWGENTVGNTQGIAHGDIESTEQDTKEPEDAPEQHIPEGVAFDDAKLFAWGPEAGAHSSLSKVQLDSTSTGTAEEQEEKVLQVIQAFWSLVDRSRLPTDERPPKQDTLNNLLQQLDLTETPTDPPNLPSTPTEQARNSFSTNKPSDTPPTSSSPPATEPVGIIHTSPASATHPCATTPRSPNSTISHYDKQRRILKQRKHEDANKYYSDWLYISRCEIRETEGPEGRRIFEPQRGRR